MKVPAGTATISGQSAQSAKDFGGSAVDLPAGVPQAANAAYANIHKTLVFMILPVTLGAYTGHRRSYKLAENTGRKPCVGILWLTRWRCWRQLRRARPARSRA